MKLSIGARLREERLRLGLSQEAFASLAGLSKRVQLKWEKDESAPSAPILRAFAEAGADVLYILTGRRTVNTPFNTASMIEAELATARAEIVHPPRHAGETAEQAERRVLDWHANSLSTILKFDTRIVPEGLAGDVAQLLEVITDPERRAAFRASYGADRRERRRSMKREIAIHLAETPHDASDTVRTMLADIGLEHGVPISSLIELFHEIAEEAEERYKPDRRRPLEPAR
ncbi:helix-turn-helix domain-containing protein [Sphingomonas bacterium]|uniref:helix-turn-helix domain-containing protein n=1 Tax=Sphingomonas bacterium TaxID=1895847 RepID=UPI001C2D068B|nr:helix-turn-helix transcriptional regulator [Sphingomonas bacterium]